MHINVEHGDHFATLHLRGEFDTYYCKLLQDQVDALLAGGINRIILNLRQVRFINSTALGAIIKASKSTTTKGGKLVIERPSPFCREIIGKVGVDRVVPIFETEEEARVGVFAEKSKPSAAAATGATDDEATVLFSPTDAARIEHFLSAARRTQGSLKTEASAAGQGWSGLGRMASLDERGLHFGWNGGDTGMDIFAMGQLLAIGTELRVRFRLPLLKTGYCEALAVVAEVEERGGGVKIGAAFTKIDEKSLLAVKQYSADMKFLKDELRKATQG